MTAFEHPLFIPSASKGVNILDHVAQAVHVEASALGVPIRFVVSESNTEGFDCEIAFVDDSEFREAAGNSPSIFEFSRRPFERQDKFTAVLLIPTGIGCEIGGHAGDATPIAHLLAANCDTLILHPNVVNASDINEAPANSLYCEGSVLTRLIMGTLGIRPVRNNRVLVVYDGNHDTVFKNATQNSINAARAVYGLNCVGIREMKEPVQLTYELTQSGRASGTVQNLGVLISNLHADRHNFDAVAVASIIEVPEGTNLAYFSGNGKMINPWGGVEALLTHSLTSALGVPTAHSPMMESEEIANADVGVVDARLAAEAVSTTFINCVLKGMLKSPQLAHGEKLWEQQSVLSATDVSCVIIPDGCLGLPTLAALYQGIPVIAVRENQNLMKNQLSYLPWSRRQFFCVDNYWEACGVMSALRAGIDPRSVRRPIAQLGVDENLAERLSYPR